MRSDLLISEEFEQELEEVVRRPKFDPALLLATRLKLFNAFVDAAVPVVIRERIAECRDIKDNKVLELAVSGNADLILTGDKDLLVLHPFRGIPILNPLQFLALHAANDLP